MKIKKLWLRADVTLIENISITISNFTDFNDSPVELEFDKINFNSDNHNLKLNERYLFLLEQSFEDSIDIPVFTDKLVLKTEEPKFVSIKLIKKIKKNKERIEVSSEVMDELKFYKEMAIHIFGTANIKEIKQTLFEVEELRTRSIKNANYENKKNNKKYYSNKQFRHRAEEILLIEDAIVRNTSE